MSLDGADIRARLTARLAEIDAEDCATQDDRKPVELDQTAVGRLSRMDSLQVQAMAEATKARRGAEKKRIHAALKRLDEDEFGYCVKCGEAIAPARLEIDLTVAMCVRCAG